MADKKRKNKDETTNKKERSSNKMMKHKHSNSKKGGGRGDKGKRTGPHLPNALRREVDRLNPTSNPLLSDEEIDSDDANDIYEYEEAIPEEESRKNRRYDSVENFEYQLPDQFKDENVESDDEDDVDDFGGMKRNLEGETDEEEDEKRHARMLQDVSGLPSDVFEGRKRKNNIVISEAYPENEYNPSGDVLDGNTNISIHDLLGPLHGKTGINKLKKSVHQVEAKSTSLDAPLSKPDRERLERIATYGISKKDITRWEPLIKRNREATTIYFDQEKNVGFSTVGAIASDFEPRTAFEKQMAALVNNNEVAEAHKNDGARLLELNKISVEEVKDRQNHLAKMRNLLFQHEMKAKRVKKIKSKTYHRLLKKDRLKATANEIAMDPEAAKELAKKQEFKRAQERLTLKHKNKNKWAKRIIERGVQDEGTKAAIAEQLHQHALLTRKMNTMRDDDSSSDDDMSSDDDDNGVSTSSDQEGASKLLERAKKKTLELLEDDDEMPKSGVHSLPFMVRGSKKRKAATEEEAKLALDEYESSLKQLEDESNGSGVKTGTTSSGRRVFGAPKQQVKESSKKKIRSDNYYGNTDSEDEFEAKEDVGHAGRDYLHKDVDIDPDILREESEIRHDDVFKSFDEIVKDPGPKTAYEVALFANDSWQKKKNLPQSTEQMKSENKVDANGTKSSQVVTPALQAQEIEELENDSDTDGEVGMVDGILTSVNKSTYELPSQADLIRRAFAGDDVEEEFVKDKEEMLNEENPEPEKPILLPGWGQWTHVQKKRGLPNWMVAEHENAKKKREEALRKRKDAHLKNVIISEKVDKKAEKLHTKTLPYPYTSKEVFEQSIRMPIGPEFNPATAIGALNRPEVVKKSGVIIKPIKFKEVNPHGRGEHKQSGQKGKGQKRKK